MPPTEHPHKRTDPKKLQADRDAIRKQQSAADSSMEALDQELDRKGYSGSPNPLKSFVQSVQGKIAKRKGRRLGFGPAPSLGGASVIGTKKPPNTS